MKKVILLMAAAFLAVLAFSCKKPNENGKNPAVPQSSASKKVDLDLSKANYNIVSSVAVDIMFDPEKYAGKKMKITKELKQSKGITLIALIITIVILLILAVVTINLANKFILVYTKLIIDKSIWHF